MIRKAKVHHLVRQIYVVFFNEYLMFFLLLTYSLSFIIYMYIFPFFFLGRIHEVLTEKVCKFICQLRFYVYI